MTAAKGPASGTEPLVTLEDADFAYEGRAVVQGASFAVHPGDYLCIVGPNGSGKSTLVLGLARLKSPSHGSVRFASGFGRRQVGYLSQQALQNKDFPASVQEVVSTGRLGRLGLRPYYSQADREAVSLSLARLQAEDLAKRSFNELSGGQRQRVLLARAICAAQRMLVLDEPATGLDVALQAELEQVIAELRAERSMAVVMVSHDVQGAVEHASHILHLNTSQEFFGTAAAYRASGVGKGFAGCVHEGHAPIAHGGRGGGSHA